MYSVFINKFINMANLVEYFKYFYIDTIIGSIIIFKINFIFYVIKT